MEKQKLLKLRKEIKKRKPKYVRQQYGYFARLSKEPKWRKPRGIHSKILMRRKGHRRMPEVGYGSPKEIRGLNREGKKEVIVYNVNDLKNIDKKNEVVVIASSVGKKKRLDILKKCKELKLDVSNYKEIGAAIEKIEKLIAKKKEIRKEKEKKELEKKKEEKKKESEKKEKDKKISKEKDVEKKEVKNNDKKEKGGN